MYFTFVCMGVLLACMCMSVQVCAVPSEGQKRALDHWDGIYIVF